MDTEYLEEQNLSSIKVGIVLINYLIAVLGGYKKLGIYLTIKLENSGGTYINPLIQIFLYCVIIAISVWGMYPLIKEGFYNFKKEHFKDAYSILLVAGMVIGIIFFIFWILDVKISLNMMEKYEARNIFLTIFSASVYAPVVEELVFRGAMLNVMKFKNKHLSLLIISVIFSIGHVKGYEFGFGLFVYFIVFVVLGFSFGMSYIYTKSILGAILSHLYWNSITIVIMIVKLIVVWIS